MKGIKARYVVRNGREGVEVDVVVCRANNERIRERKMLTGPLPEDARRAAVRRGEAWALERHAYLMQHGKESVEARVVSTLAEFAPRFVADARANRQKPSTIETKESVLKVHLLPAFGPFKLDQITQAKLSAFKASLGHLKAKSVANILGVLSALLRTAIEWEEIGEMPCRIKLPKFYSGAVRFYEPETFEGLVAAAGKIGAQAELVMLLGGDAGLRLGEMIALEQTDVDYRRGMIRIERSERRGQLTTPKSGKGREVPATPRLLAALRGHRHLRGDRVLWRDEEAPGQRSTKLEPAKLNRNDIVVWMKATQKRANIKADGAIHILRHTYGARLATAGAAPKAIQELMGHSDLTTTLRYLHLAKGAKEAAVALLSLERNWSGESSGNLDQQVQ